MVGAGGATGSLDASNIFKPSLARGDIHCIGATTIDEYRKLNEQDKIILVMDKPLSRNYPELFEENNVFLIRADWTRPNKNINVFLEKYDRFLIPFNAFFSKNFPNGILLSELLSEKEIVNAMNRIKNDL